MSNDDLVARLDRVRGHITAPSQVTVSSKIPSRYHKLANDLGGTPVTNHAGCFCQVSTLYPFGTDFGESRLNKLNSGTRFPVASFSAVELEGEVALGDLTFLDTETTGLGGAGAVAFLVGCGSLTETGFEVRQYMLPDYSDETAMLEHILNELTEQSSIVSYNGAAFDLNLLRDRMIINRVARQVPFHTHIDLLHSARRLFRRRLGDCTLTNIEREIFGFHRSDDIPGYLIPSVYFNWLDSEETCELESVLEHNRLDILALYFLLLRVAEIHRTEGSTLEHRDDIYALSRVYGRRRRHDKVTEVLAKIGDADRESLEEDVLLYLSFALKRTGEWADAIRIWLGLAEGKSRESYQANLELAKYFEHRSKDLEKAYYHASLAGKTCPERTVQPALLSKRLDRLRFKMS